MRSGGQRSMMFEAIEADSSWIARNQRRIIAGQKNSASAKKRL